VPAAECSVSLNVSRPSKTEVALEGNDLYLTLDLYNVDISMSYFP